jgi:hypothetical protein
MMTDKVTMTVSQDGATGRLQLAVHKVDETGAGHGYRIAGAKFSGSGRTLLTRVLTAEDAAEIRRYLDAVFPLAELEHQGAAAAEYPAGTGTPED